MGPPAARVQLARSPAWRPREILQIFLREYQEQMEIDIPGLGCGSNVSGIVVSEAVRGRGNLACAVAEPGLSLLGNNVQMEA